MSNPSSGRWVANQPVSIPGTPWALWYYSDRSTIYGPGTAPRNVGLYHLAWEVATLGELVEAKQQLAEMGALVGENNHGMSRSLYCQDPDGIEFEVMWEVPLDLYDPSDPSNVPLDLDADIARWGADRPGRGA